MCHAIPIANYNAEYTSIHLILHWIPIYLSLKLQIILAKELVHLIGGIGKLQITYQLLCLGWIEQLTWEATWSSTIDVLVTKNRLLGIDNRCIGDQTSIIRH